MQAGIASDSRGCDAYFGGSQIDAATCALAAIDLKLPQFAISIRDIRMLRIEEQNDLQPAMRQAAPGGNPPGPTPVR